LAPLFDGQRVADLAVVHLAGLERQVQRDDLVRVVRCGDLRQATANYGKWYARGPNDVHPHVLSRRVTADYVSYAECALLLSVSERTVRQMVADDELPAVRVRGQVRIPIAALRNLPPFDPDEDV
jgi:excisionase family DNA binding protein